MQYSAPTTAAILYISHVLMLLKKPDTQHVSNAGQLETELTALRRVLRRLEAKYMGRIQSADGERLDRDVKRCTESAKRLVPFVQGAAWEGPGGDPLVEMAECRAALEVHDSSIVPVRIVEPIYDDPTA